MYPFHISLEGIEQKILCRETDDYDCFVKIIQICALRKDVIVIMYVAVSNHAHIVVLAESQKAADDYGDEIKRMYSMHFSRKYGGRSVMKHLDAKAIYIDSDWYLRNAVAYDIRNSYDNGAENVQSYKWSGYAAMFCNGKCRGVCLDVATLSRREKRRLLHTDDDLSSVKWKLDENGELEPASVCDWRYLEAAFGNDQTFFLKVIGTVNKAEMETKLDRIPRTMMKDEEFLRYVNEISHRWYSSEIGNVPVAQKLRLVKFVYHSCKTGVPQLSRAFELDRCLVASAIGLKSDQKR